jgi:hypothetical protein
MFNKIQLDSSLRSILRSALVVVALFLLISMSGSGLGPGLGVAVVVCVQYVVGSSLWKAIRLDNYRSQLGICAAKFLLGVLVSTCSHMAFVGSRFESQGWWIPLLPILPFAILTRKTNSVVQLEWSNWLISFFAVSGTTMLLLGRTYVWQFPWGISLLLVVAMLLLLKSRMNRVTKFTFTSLIASSVGWFAYRGVMRIGDRAGLWWTRNSDITHIEAASKSLAGWGFGEHLAAIGDHSLGSYHWLTLAWTGLVARVSGTENWFMGTRGAHIIFVALSVSALWALFREHLRFSPGAATSALLLSSWFSLTIGANFTHMTAMPWFLVVLIFSSWNVYELPRHGISLVLFMTGLGLLLTKPQLGVVLLSGILLVVLVRNLFSGRGWKHGAHVSAPLFAAIIVMFALQITLGGGLSGSSGEIRLDFISEGSFGEVGAGPNALAFPLALTVLLGVLTPLGALWYTLWLSSELKNLIWTTMAASGSAAVALLIVDSNFAYLPGYLFGIMTIFFGVLLGCSFSVIAGVFKFQTRSTLALVVTSAIVFLASSRWTDYTGVLFTDTEFDTAVRVLVGIRWIPAALIALGLFIILRSKKSWLPDVLTTRSATLLFVVLLANPVSIVRNVIDDSRRPTSSSSDDSAGILAFTSDIQSLQQFVARNTETDDVFASNFFCAYDAKSLCATSNWWESFERQLADNFEKGCHDLLVWSTDWSLPAILDRRFLIQGPQMFTRCAPAPAWIGERVMNSELFAREATRNSFELLCSYGVSWFLVDKEVTVRRTWENYGNPRFENARFSLVKINEGLCFEQAF